MEQVLIATNLIVFIGLLYYKKRAENFSNENQEILKNITKIKKILRQIKSEWFFSIGEVEGIKKATLQSG